MKKKRYSNEKALHEMAVRLCEGGTVWYNGHFLKAKRIDTDDNPCYLCEMDSACDMNMTDLCGECEAYSRRKYMLYFACKTD